MNGKITSPEAAWEEGTGGESRDENPTETSGKPIVDTYPATCDDEYLLKACASRQEKAAICYKNSAAADANIGDPRVKTRKSARIYAPRAQPHVARPADFTPWHS